MQIRIKLPSLNPLVRNNILILDNRCYKHYFNFFYDKILENGSKKIVEYYHNGQLQMYSETERYGTFIEINCFDANGKIFSREKKFYNQDEEIFKEYQKIYNADDTILEYTGAIST